MQTLPDNTCIYAIGDIHGRADLLNQLHARILHDALKYPQSRRVIIYLGDYIDRGHASKDVIDQLIHNPLSDFTAIHLRGNHENMLLDFLKNNNRGDIWFMNGGLETLKSYHVPLSLLNELNYEKLAVALKQKMSPDHIAFFESLKTHHIEGSYFFCHAGVNPNIPLEQQSEEDLTWIREPFLNSKKKFGKIVVHGHTVSKEPILLPNQIGIDTGAVFTNRLTCVVLTQNEPYFLTT
jgi:serine/threonine protein phosphatase 1